MTFRSVPLVTDAWALVSDGLLTDSLICTLGAARIVCGDVVGQPIEVGIPMSPGEKIVTPSGLQVWACGAGAETMMLVTPFSA